MDHERIGRYEVLRKIATGGMAELFLAKQVGMEGFEKVVAIKRILAHLAYDEEFINMFRDEARIVAKLSHPNVVQIYDLGKSDDTYFIAMEYIPGRNLSSIAKRVKLKQERIPPEYIARCVAQACEGLYYAHTRKDIDGRPLQIVHRDVSPQNIIVSFSGTVKLVDFGIAKAATKIAHTRAGVLKGKYAYMSPEQIRGEEIDARSDLFAVGIVLYELMAGRRPFEKDNSIQTLKAIVQEKHVDIRDLNPDVNDELSGIIDKALTKDPNRRYQDAQEIQIALEDFVSSSANRCNNITISNWVQSLFAEELSRERGGTMVFKGVGEVILPEVDPAEPDEGAVPPAEASEPVGLARGRGGGSVERPPIQAPSNSLIESMAEYEVSQASQPSHPSQPSVRRKMIQELERPRMESTSSGGFDDDATVHALDELPPTRPSNDVLEEDAIDRPLKPIIFDDSKTEFSPPSHEVDEDTSEHPVFEDPGPMSDADLDAPTISPDRPFKAVEAPQPVLELMDAEPSQPEESWGDLSGNFEQKARRDDLWDDKTAHNNDAYLADDSIPAPVVSEVAPPHEIDDVLSTDDEFGGEATIAAPSIEFPDDSSEGFGEDATLHIKELLKDDSGGWSGDATAAAPDDVVLREQDDEIEVPMVSEEEASLDDEPALPDGVDLSRDVDQDSATLAGVTSDFLSAGLKPPAHTYEPKARPEKSEVTPRPAPSPKQEKLGAIRLSKVAAVPESGVFEVGFTANEEVTEGDLGADSPLEEDPAPVSAMDFEFEDSAYDEGELPSKVKPKTEAAVHRDLYDQAQEEYSALVAPKAVQPLSPVARGQGAMHIGSSNVPPASLSLSDMLHDPQARANSAKIIDDPNQNRSATMLGRQIREVVRSDSLDSRPQPLVQPQPYDAPTEEDNDPELMNAPVAYEPPTYSPPPQPRRGVQRSRLLMGALIAVGIACLATMAYFLIPLIAGSSQHLTIRTTPVGATVYVDEKLQEGTTPLTIKGLEPGISYQIRLEREGYEPISREVRLPPNRPLIWQIPLKPKPSVTSAN